MSVYQVSLPSFADGAGGFASRVVSCLARRSMPHPVRRDDSSLERRDGFGGAPGDAATEAEPVHAQPIGVGISVAAVGGRGLKVIESVWLIRYPNPRNSTHGKNAFNSVAKSAWTPKTVQKLDALACDPAPLIPIRLVKQQLALGVTVLMRRSGRKVGRS